MGTKLTKSNRETGSGWAHFSHLMKAGASPRFKMWADAYIPNADAV